MSSLRMTAPWTLLACALLIGGCGGDDGGSDLTTAAATTSLPLQGEALDVGGDVQDRATDIIEIGLTEEQLEKIRDACEDTLEITGSDDDLCGRETTVQPGPPIHTCGPPLPACLRIRAYADTDQKVLGDGGYIEITDEQPGKPLCGTDAGGVCMRIGVSSAAALDDVVDPGTPSPTTPPTTETSTSSTSTASTTPTTTSGGTTSETGSGSASASASETEGAGSGTARPQSTP